MLLFCSIYSQYSYLLIFIAIIFFSSKEFYRILKENNINPNNYLGIFLSFLIFISTFIYASQNSIWGIHFLLIPILPIVCLSALYASGRRVFSRSFKYHRPRGLLCVGGNCPNCLVTVNGVPNVKACEKPAEMGMLVNSQNTWPSLNTDFFSIFDKMGWLMPVGFYYKFFHRHSVLLIKF